MTEIQLPPRLSALCRECETVCEAACCGIGAFNFSPFSLIHHLSRVDAGVQAESVAALRADLDAFAASIHAAGPAPGRLTITELNAALTPDQAQALAAEIAAALTEAEALWAEHGARAEARYAAFQKALGG